MPERESEQTSARSFLTNKQVEPPCMEEQMAAQAEQAQAGASMRVVDGWHAIDWRAVAYNVKRLQARIVKATQSGKHGKAKALQWVLTHSFSARAEAVRRVTENSGKHTAGVDGVTWRTPDRKIEAVRNTGRRRGYKPLPLRRIYIPKASNPAKLRPLGIPTMRDRAEQALHLLGLDPIAETIQDANSYGFRRERSPADAIQQCFNALGKRHSPEWVLEGDIKACFDEISHDWLLEHIPMHRKTLGQWLKAGYIERSALHATDAGTPQGGIISPVLANLALDGMEKTLRAAYPLSNQKGRRGKVNLVRFADDFIVTAATREILANEVRPMLEAFLHQRGLRLSDEKTHITHIDDGFDFLGQNIRRFQGTKLIITPSKRSVSAVKRRIHEVIKRNCAASGEELIRQLNPIMRGWCNYHRHVCSSRTFWKLTDYVFHRLISWARRKHRGKNMVYFKTRYFADRGGHAWVFSVARQRADGMLERVYLEYPSHIHIERHVKVKSDANPYDPAWESYFEARGFSRTRDAFAGRIDLETLHRRQQGVCQRCGQAITPETGWERHHVQWRVFGGTDALDNLCLLHPNCHRQLHSQAGRLDRRRDLADGLS